MTFAKFKKGLSLMMLPVIASMLFVINSSINNNIDTNKTRASINKTYHASLSQKLKPVNIDIISVANNNDNFTIVGKNQNKKIVTYNLNKLPTIDNQKIQGYYSGSRIYASPKQYKQHVTNVHDFAIKNLNKLNSRNIALNVFVILIDISALIILYIINVKLAQADEKLKEILKED